MDYSDCLHRSFQKTANSFGADICPPSTAPCHSGTASPRWKELVLFLLKPCCSLRSIITSFEPKSKSWLIGPGWTCPKPGHLESFLGIFHFKLELRGKKVSFQGQKLWHAPLKNCWRPCFSQWEGSQATGRGAHRQFSAGKKDRILVAPESWFPTAPAHCH